MSHKTNLFLLCCAMLTFFFICNCKRMIYCLHLDMNRLCFALLPFLQLYQSKVSRCLNKMHSCIIVDRGLNITLYCNIFFYYNHSHHCKMRKNYHLEKVVKANISTCTMYIIMYIKGSNSKQSNIFRNSG